MIKYVIENSKRMIFAMAMHKTKKTWLCSLLTKGRKYFSTVNYQSKSLNLYINLYDKKYLTTFLFLVNTLCLGKIDKIRGVGVWLYSHPSV